MVRYFFIFLCLAIPGCIVPVPHPEYALHKRPGVDKTLDAAFIKPGATSREAILLTLGEPDFRWRDDRVNVYHWTISNMTIFWAIGGAGSAAGGAIPVSLSQYLLIEFNADNIVTRVEQKHEDWVTLLKLKTLEETWPSIPQAVSPAIPSPTTSPR